MLIRSTAIIFSKWLLWICKEIHYFLPSKMGCLRIFSACTAAFRRSAILALFSLVTG